MSPRRDVDLPARSATSLQAGRVSKTYLYLADAMNRVSTKHISPPPNIMLK